MKKRALALELIACRWAAALSQEEVAVLAGLSLATVRHLKSLTGAMPGGDIVARYRNAREGQGPTR